MSTRISLLPALQCLQERPQWVCWRKETRRGTLTKIPYNPQTGGEAKSNNPATWTGYAVAKQAYVRSQRTKRPYDGLGFVFASKGNITGIDLDHCIAPDGTVDTWAQEWIERLHSYTEYSPSGEGFHIYVSGTFANPSGDMQKLKGKRHEKAAIEVYSERRYFTVTERHVKGTPVTIEANQEALDALSTELCALGAAARPEKKRQAARPHAVISLDDEQLLKKAVEARNGEKFRALFYHGPQGYPSASEADMALCLMLAFWTGRDTTRMDRLYRKSALYRQKWDTERRASTYGWDTIHKAAAVCTVVYDPRRTHAQLERDIEQVLQQIAQQQARSNTPRTRKPYQLAPKEVPTAKVLDYLNMNEYGDALFFAEVFAGQVCYDHTAGEWYLWDGHAWKRDETSKVRQLVAGVLGSLYLRAAADLNTTQAELDLKIQALQREGVKDSDAQMSSLKEQYKALAGQIGELHSRARALRSAKRMRDALTFVQSEMGITSDRWDTPPWLLAVPNGVLDLRTGVCHDGHPGDYLRTVTPTEWTGLDTPCPRFERYLQEIFEDRPDRDTLIAFLQRLLGYAITGLTTHHLFPILYGQEGRNGKDTLLKILKAVLGALVGAVSNDVFIAQDKLRSAGAATPHLVDLQGKRLVWGSETKEGDRLNIAQIKLLTGGGEISARKLHGHQYAFTPTHKLLLMTNYKPQADARDKAFWSRACLIEFGLRFIEKPQAANERLDDKTLEGTLKQECSGILAWLVRGCLAWQEQGLNIPDSVRLATDKYRDEEDRILLFIQECCIVKPEAWVRASALFSAYHSWYETNQFGGRGLNSKLFGDEMKKRFQRKEDMRGRTYLGIGLLTDDPDQEPLPFSGDPTDKQASYGGSMEGHSSPSIPSIARLL